MQYRSGARLDPSQMGFGGSRGGTSAVGGGAGLSCGYSSASPDQCDTFADGALGKA